MNSNWSRLKRKLNENKQNHNHKRRKLTPPDTSKTKPKSPKSSKKGRNNRPFITKYLNSSSNPVNSITAKTDNYRSQTPKKQLFETMSLIPPESTNHDMEQRKAWWNDIRLKLRARLPKEFLFKLITPIKYQNTGNSHNKSSKLHQIDPNVALTNIVALDCEMVGIGNGKKSILARISIVNYFGEAVYDKFVQPINDPNCLKITDFREEITGINRQDLVRFGITFEQCQREIIALLKGRKMIGHAINNDFAVIKCANILKKNFYANVGSNDGNDRSKRQIRKLLSRKTNESWFFDTSKSELLNENVNRPRSLKFLLELYLGVHIQSDEHDSVIDAVSTMAIYRAVLPEIRAHKKVSVVSKKERVRKRKDRKDRKAAERERLGLVRENQMRMNNYAYDNELDRLLARFGDENAGK